MTRSKKLPKMRGKHDSKPAISEKVNNHFWFSEKITDWMPTVKERHERQQNYRDLNVGQLL